VDIKKGKNELTATLPKITGYFDSNNFDLLPKNYTDFCWWQIKKKMF